MPRSLGELVTELAAKGYRLSLDQKRTNGKWKAEAWRYYMVWSKKGDAVGDTPEEAIEALIAVIPNYCETCNGYQKIDERLGGTSTHGWVPCPDCT